ncbi:hypothetical protein BES08_26000 (plasmid) [Novosphingobium resinovorum]|uniref:Uncharacterized protein n=1 Tax=Novosphingobium resinovorum TaxID=158500 RepID=A0A1D8AE61_9SPHN|nr:hypothetical protein BES08_26000 [Novosphingobium resinovorum]
MPIQISGLRFGGIANCLGLLLQLVGLRICLRFDSVSLILERIRLRITRLSGGTIYAVRSAASALSGPVPLIRYTRSVGSGFILRGTCLLLRCAATTTMAGRVASSKDVPEAFAVASSEWFP